MLDSHSESLTEFVQQSPIAAEAELFEAREAVSNRVIASRKAIDAASIQEVRIRTGQACTAFFLRDEVAALTNPVRNPVFMSNGLPAEKITAPRSTWFYSGSDG